MKFLLDTNPCIQVIRGRNPLVIARYRSHPPSDMSVCSPVVAELRHGAARSRHPAAELAKVRNFLRPHHSLPFDDDAAAIYADIRADLEVQGTPIGQFDTMIAAIALAHGLTLVTHNTAEFARVPGLQLVDWERP